MRTLAAAVVLAVVLGRCGPGVAGDSAPDGQAPGLRPPTEPAMAAVPPGVPFASASDLVGRPVLGPDGKEAGRIERLLVDATGQVRAVVIAWGGFLGVSKRRAVLLIGQVRQARGGAAHIALTGEQLEALPDFDPENPHPAMRRLGWPGETRFYP